MPSSPARSKSETVVALLLVALRRARRDLALRPVADGVADAALLLAEGEGVAGAARSRRVMLSIFFPVSS